MKKKATKAITLLCFLLIIYSQNSLNATVFTSVQSGSFSAGSTWVGGAAPGYGDDIIIATGHTVTLDAAAASYGIVTVFNITIQTGATLNNDIYKLQINRATVGNPIYSNNGTHNGPGNIIAYENFKTSLSGNGVTNCNIEMISGYALYLVNTCHLTINGDIFYTPQSNPIGSAATIEADQLGATIIINGDIIADDLFTENAIINLATIMVNGNISFTSSGSVIDNSGILNITGNLSLGAASSYCQNKGSMVIGGNLTGAFDTYFIQEANAIIKFGGSVFPNDDGFLFTVASPITGLSEPNIIEYNGIAAQNIALPTDGAYSNLVINNTSSGGVQLITDISVNGDLTLTDGFVNLGANNLILGSTSVILGTPSANNMIVATGTGELRKVIASTGSFTFPVGDNDVTAEYSPVTLDFTTGTFSGEYVGVNLLNSSYAGVTGSYLNRNWSITSPGLAGFTCNATFEYTPADVVGTESSIYCFRVAPTTDLFNAANTSLHLLTATDLNSFGTFTGKQQDMVPPPLTTTWTGNSNSEWFTADNWSDGVPGDITQVTIPGGLSNYPTLSATATIAGITINSGASFIGSEFLTTTTALVERDIVNSNYHYISSPVASVSFGSVFPLNQSQVWAREYNEITGDWDNLTIADILSVGKGYSVQMSQPQTALFSGALNSSPVTSTLSKQNPGADANRVGWNLLGNPFTSAVDWDLTDHSTIDGSVYVWNGTQYVSWNGTTGALTNGIIPAENAFFAKTIVHGATLTIPLAARVNSSIGFYKSVSSISNLLELTTEGNSNTDKTYVHFNEQATAGFDNQYDAYKLFGNDNAPQLYSMITGDVLSINELPMAGNEVVNLGFKCNTTGDYTVSVSGTDNFSANVPVLLHDVKLDITQDLRINPVYSFSYEAGEPENRFMLLFLDVTGIEELASDIIRVFSFDKTVVVENANLLKGDIRIYDITGREILAQKLTSQMRTDIQLQAVAGTYLIKVFTASRLVNAKVVIH